MNKFNVKENNTIKYLIVIALLLCILSLIFFNTYAKYADEGSGEDDARVAVWAVDTSDESSAYDQTGVINKKVSVDASVARYTFTVANYDTNNLSEAALEYSIIVTIPQELSGIDMKVVDASGNVGNLDQSESTTTRKVYKNDNWKMPASEYTVHVLNLIFSRSTDASDNIVYDGIKVEADFRQID